MARFCIDIDNVVAATDTVMRRVIADYTGDRVRLEHANITTFNYYDCRDPDGQGITRDDWPRVHEIFSEPGNLWLIQPVAGAIDGLHALARHGTLHLATARLPKARRVTVEWLDNFGVPAHELHFLRHGQKHVSLPPFTAAVEDDYAQAISFASAGATPCFLLTYPWNCKTAARPAASGVEWVADWSELTGRLLESVK
jgi:uncharacterized HAD superfamily protein